MNRNQFGTVVFYMVVAISMILLNKSEGMSILKACNTDIKAVVLSSTPLPVFLLLCQSCVAVLLLAVENRVGPIKKPTK